jgi:hypothetical protein
MSALPSAADRLVASRERLRLAMRSQKPQSGDGAARAGSASEDAAGNAGSSWQRLLQSIPAGSIVIDAVGSWWAQHPMRVAGIVAAEAGNAAIRPLAKRHPLALALGALLLGGLFTWARPWRWVSMAALFAGLVPQLLSKAMTAMPPSSWMAVLSSLTQQQPHPPAEPPPSKPVS